jgi:hypothetical protein
MDDDKCLGFREELTSFNLKEVSASHVIFPDENHGSVSLSSLSRGMAFALPLPNLKSPANPAEK